MSIYTYLISPNLYCLINMLPVCTLVRCKNVFPSTCFMGNEIKVESNLICWSLSVLSENHNKNHKNSIGPQLT